MSKKCSIFARKIACEMKLLLVLLSVMTFTVESKTKVSASGTWPYEMSASYACSYQKGDVRANDTATLRVSGLEGTTIEYVRLYLKSNKNGGAGVITIDADDVPIYSLNGTYAEWFGAYSTEYQPIGWSGTQAVNELEVQIIGTANSLHIEKYEIGWYQTSDAYDVRLMKGEILQETLRGAKVTLPTMEDENDWHFIGWTTAPVAEQSEKPEKVYQGSFEPKSDITLWALYTYQPSVEQSIATELQNGVYLYANTVSNLAISGGIVDGHIGSAIIDMADMSQWYEVTFDTDSTAVIQLLYTYEYIGYSGKQLASEPSVWKVYHSGEKTAFYAEANGKNYVLWPPIMEGIDFVETSDVSQSPTVLVNVEAMLDGPIYSCYPERGLAIELTTDSSNAVATEGVVMSFGNYELIIRKGQKELRKKD